MVQKFGGKPKKKIELVQKLNIKKIYKPLLIINNEEKKFFEYKLKVFVFGYWTVFYHKKENSLSLKNIKKIHLKYKYFFKSLSKNNTYLVSLLGLKNDVLYENFFILNDVYFCKKKKFAKLYKNLYRSEKLLKKYISYIDKQILLFNLLKFEFWVKGFYTSFIGAAENNSIFLNLQDKQYLHTNKLSYLNQFYTYSQHPLMVVKDLYIKKFIMQRWLRKKLKDQKNISLFNRVILTKDLYTNSYIGLRFCNMFMRKGEFGKILKIFIKLNVYFKTVHGFELIYLLILLLYLYKVPYGNRQKKKSGKILTIPMHIPLERFFFKFFNLFTKAIKKRTDLSIFLRLSNEIEALLLNNKVSFFFKDFSELVDLTLSGRSNLLKKKRRIKKKLKGFFNKGNKQQQNVKKYRRRKKRGLKSRLHRSRINKFITIKKSEENFNSSVVKSKLKKNNKKFVKVKKLKKKLKLQKTPS